MVKNAIVLDLGGHFFWTSGIDTTIDNDNVWTKREFPLKNPTIYPQKKSWNEPTPSHVFAQFHSFLWWSSFCLMLLWYISSVVIMADIIIILIAGVTSVWGEDLLIAIFQTPVIHACLEIVQGKKRQSRLVVWPVGRFSHKKCVQLLLFVTMPESD